MLCLASLYETDVSRNSCYILSQNPSASFFQWRTAKGAQFALLRALGSQLHAGQPPSASVRHWRDSVSSALRACFAHAVSLFAVLRRADGVRPVKGCGHDRTERAKKKMVVVEEQVPTADGTPLAAEEAPSSPAKSRSRRQGCRHRRRLANR